MEHTAAVIGCGYWGPNIARNLVDFANLKYVVDKNLELASEVAEKYEGVQAIGDVQVALDDEEVDMIAIVTPPSTHAELTERALAANKHVFVEKPLAHSEKDAMRMLNVALEYPYAVCCVGHTFLFVPEIIKMRELIKNGLIGNIDLISVSRLNFGKYQECGVAMDLLPHDISIMEFLLDRESYPLGMSTAELGGISVVGSATFGFKGSSARGAAAMSWVHTDKTRKLIVTGSRGVLEFDMSMPHFVKHYVGRDVRVNRSGDLRLIEIDDHSEALASEMKYWISLINNPGSKNKISFTRGYSVVKTIEGLRDGP